jgi:hypothetical protein
MKLAELLVERAELQKKFGSLKTRAAQNATFSEGGTPAEDPEKLIAEAMTTLRRLTEVVQSINMANITAKMPDGRTIMATIAERDQLMHKHVLLSTVIEACGNHRLRYSRNEIRTELAVKVPDLQKQLDEVGHSLRRLNLALQEQNWKIDI